MIPLVRSGIRTVLHKAQVYVETTMLWPANKSDRIKKNRVKFAGSHDQDQDNANTLEDLHMILLIKK